MATFEVVAPDGTKYDVTAPDDATEQQVLDYVRRTQVAQPSTPVAATPQQKQAAIQATQGPVPLIAMGHGLDRLAAGAKQAVNAIPRFGPPIVSGVDRLNDMLGLGRSPTIDPAEQQANEAEYRKLQQVSPGQAFLGELPIYAAATTPVGMATLGALEYGTPKERAIRGGLGYVGGKVGEKLAGALASKLAGSGTAINPVRDATIREAQQAGLVLPPSQIRPDNPGFINRIAEGIAGKLTTAQLAGIKNQPVVNAIAKRELGIAADVPLTTDAINAVRKSAGKAYEAVRKVGTVEVDDAFAAQLGDTIGSYAQLAGQFPSQRNPAVDALIKDLAQPQLESGAIVDLVKRLRFDGFRNVKAQDPAVSQLGKVQVAAQEALEDLLERQLAKWGYGDLLVAFRNARTLIAKSHTIENALEESTGNVIASKIGREFSKGRPLSGGLATIGKAGEAFPRAMQNMNTSMPGMSPLDAMASIAGAGVTGNPAGAALPYLRPLLRSAILSPAYQRMFASPGKGGGLLNIEPSSAALLRDLMGESGGLLGAAGAMYGR